MQITLPNDTMNLDGTVTAPDDIPTATWAKVSSLGTVTFADAGWIARKAADPTIKFPVEP